MYQLARIQDTVVLHVNKMIFINVKKVSFECFWHANDGFHVGFLVNLLLETHDNFSRQQLCVKTGGGNLGGIIERSPELLRC